MSKQDPRFGRTICKGDSYDPNTFTYIPVAIIGAGESGIAMGCRLKEKLGFDQFRIFDRQSGIGGTWYINRYPGVACDVPAVFYSFSFCQNPNWTTLYPTGPEIVRYLQDVAEKYAIIDKIQVNTDITDCHWNNEEGLWNLTLQHLAVGVGDLSAFDRKQRVENDGATAAYLRTEKVKAKVVVSCVGGLVEPNQWPENIPGKDKFQGSIFHSARWDYSVDLKDKDIIVVGTGCSAAQFVPKLRKDYGAKTVTQIMRSPPWVEPKFPQPVKPETQVWLNKHIPGYMTSWRQLFFWGGEASWLWFQDSEWAGRKREQVEATMLAHMRKQTPVKYHEILTPNYSIGCKRRIFDKEWLNSLQDEHLELTTLPITSVGEKSVTLGPGRTYPPMSDTSSKAPSHQAIIPADIIVLANGFVTTTWLHPLDVVGRGGLHLHDVFEQRGGPQMYMGAAMDEFPNFFTIFGPNTATGHSSVVLASENMVEMTLLLIAPVLKGDVATVEIKKEAELHWAKDTQRQLKKTVWHMGGCNSWYFNTKDDWNSTVYPYSQVWFGIRCLFPTWTDWTFTYTESGLKKRTRNRRIRYLATLLAIVGFLRLRRSGYSARDMPVVVKESIVHVLSSGMAMLQRGSARLRA